MPRIDSLSGHVALVTGISGSIGAEVSRSLAGLGASVAVHGRTQSRLDELTGQIRSDGGRSTAYVGDVRDAAHLGAVVADVARTWAPVDILVALAGGDGSPTPTASLGPGRWREVIETDLTSTFLTVHAVLPGMLEHGDGRIVTVASSAGRRPSQANAAYAAAKAGVIILTEHIAKEYATSGIRASCVAPSIIETATLRRGCRHRNSPPSPRACRSAGSASRRTSPTRSPSWPATARPGSPEPFSTSPQG